MNDTYQDFIDGFADATGMDHTEASEQWAGFSRHLSRSDREQIEAGGHAAGKEQGEEFNKQFA